MARGRWLDVLACGLLLLLSWLLRARLLPWFEFSSDATDPIIAALRMLETGEVFHVDSVRFGYGRAWSYLPLVVGLDEGLGGFAERRIWAQSLIAPTLYLAVRLLLTPWAALPGSSWRLGCARFVALLAGLSMVASQDLLQNLLWGHHGYLGPEWAALVLLAGAGFYSAVKLRSWALLLGLALALCVMNHPYAVVLLALPLVLLVEAYAAGHRRRAQAMGLALGGFVVSLLPQLLAVLDRPGSEADLLESLVPLSTFSLSRFPAAAAGLFANIAPLESLCYVVGFLVVVVLPASSLSGRLPRALSRPLSSLGLATALSFLLLLVLGLLSRQVHNWHWRMLLPFGGSLSALATAALLELALFAGQGQPSLRNSYRGLAALSAGLLLVALIGAAYLGMNTYRNPPWDQVESLQQLQHIERIAALEPVLSPTLPGGSLILAAGSPSESSYARTLPVTLNAVLSERVGLGLREPGLPVVRFHLYLEGPLHWQRRLAGPLQAQGLKILWQGRGSMLLSGTGSEPIGAVETICSLSMGMDVRVDPPADSSGLLKLLGQEQPEVSRSVLSAPSCRALLP